MSKKAIPAPSTNPPPTLPKLTGEQKDELRNLEKNCYENLHRPMVVKARGYSEEIWYVCQECLDKWMKENEELKKVIVAFRR